MIKVLIADDEPLARDRLRRMTEGIEGYCVLEDEARTGAEAIAIAHQRKPDVVLLDIRMPMMDGLEAAMALCQMDCPPAIIFCTAYDQYALEAFHVQAVGYLLKPVKQDALCKALQNAQRTNRSQLAALNERLSEDELQKRTHISARTYKGIELIPLNDVRFFQADNKYVTVNHIKGEVLIDETLKELENEFSDVFVRIHRNALVARRAIESMTRNDQGSYEIHLRDVMKPLQVSRRHVAEMRRLLKSL